MMFWFWMVFLVFWGCYTVTALFVFFYVLPTLMDAVGEGGVFHEDELD